MSSYRSHCELSHGRRGCVPAFPDASHFEQSLQGLKEYLGAFLLFMDAFQVIEKSVTPG